MNAILITFKSFYAYKFFIAAFLNFNSLILFEMNFESDALFTLICICQSNFCFQTRFNIILIRS